METVQFSPCVGGLVRTWSGDGHTHLWSVPADSWLRSAQATGVIARTPRGSNRFREAALLSAERATLLVQGRRGATSPDGLTMEGQIVGLAEAKRPSRATFEDFREVLTRTVRHCVTASEYLVVERGGFDAPDEPYCLFGVFPRDGETVNAIETAPLPVGSDLWRPHINPDEPGATMSAPTSPETVAVVPTLMIEAIKLWDADPWDLAFTFGRW